MTAINRTAILDILRTSGPLSRRDIVRLTGLGSATVDRLCSALLKENAIESTGLDRPAIGRPSILLRYVAERRRVAVVDVTDNCARGRIVDLAANVVFELSEDFGHEIASESDRLDGLLRLVKRLFDSRIGVHAPIEALGITLPGVVDEGVVRYCTELDWDDVPVGQILTDRFHVPVYVENDANATAYGEFFLGVAAGAQSAVSLVLGAGMGAGIVSEGGIYHGHKSAAGEVGYLLMSPTSFSRKVEVAGDMEARVSRAVLPFAGSASDHVDRRIGPAFRSMMARASQGDLDAIEAQEVFFDNVAMTCAAVAVVLAPSVIVLSGAFAQYGAVSVHELTRRLAGRLPTATRIATGTLGFDAAIEGMSAILIEHVRNATYLV